MQFVHKTTTNQPLKDHYTVVDGMCYGSGVDVNEEDVNNSTALSVTSKYLSLFPNFIIGTYFPNQIGVYLNIPIIYLCHQLLTFQIYVPQLTCPFLGELGLSFLFSY